MFLDSPVNQITAGLSLISGAVNPVNVFTGFGFHGNSYIKCHTYFKLGFTKKHWRTQGDTVYLRCILPTPFRPYTCNMQKISRQKVVGSGNLWDTNITYPNVVHARGDHQIQECILYLPIWVRRDSSSSSTSNHLSFPIQYYQSGNACIKVVL